MKLYLYNLIRMLILFIVHNLLNIRWYGNLRKGKYKPQRILQIIVNFSVLFSMLCLGFSGIVMSRYVFVSLPISRPMATARSMHMAASDCLGSILCGYFHSSPAYECLVDAYDVWAG